VIAGILERLHEIFRSRFSSVFIQTPLEGSTLWAHYGSSRRGFKVARGKKLCI